MISLGCSGRLGLASRPCRPPVVATVMITLPGSVRFGFTIVLPCSFLVARLDDKQPLAEFDEISVTRPDLHDPPCPLGVDGGEELHHLDQAQCLSFLHQ